MVVVKKEVMVYNILANYKDTNVDFIFCLYCTNGMHDDKIQTHLCRYKPCNHSHYSNKCITYCVF